MARLRAVIQDRVVFPHHLTFALPRLISKTEPEATPVIPTETDLRTMALNAMSQGIGKLGQDLANRVAALGPADSASAIAGSVETRPSAPTTEVDDDSIIIVGEEDTPRISTTRRMPPVLPDPGVVKSVSSGAPSGPAASATSSSAVRSPLADGDDLRARRLPPMADQRVGLLNSRQS